MPCKCSGVHYDRCSCKILGGYQVNDQDRPLIVQGSICPLRRTGRNIWFRAYENVYERCAGYNLRHCPLRGVCTKNFLREALRDLTTLVCFLLANFVVFFTIFARMTLHVSFAMVSSARWMRRSFLKRIIAHKGALMLTNIATRGHNFAPPRKII